MQQTASIEVHFYSEYEAAVMFESFSQGDDRKSVELRTFACYTLRQLRNLGSGGMPFAQILSSMKDNIGAYMNYHWLLDKLKTPQDMMIYIPYIAALGVDMSMVVKLVSAFVMLRLSAGGDTKELARTLWPNTAHLVLYRGQPGNKRFEAEFDLQEKDVLIDLKPKGFGVFGKGVDYYALMSVTLLLRYLTDKYDGLAKDWEWGSRLRKVAQACGQAFLDGKVTSSSEAELPNTILGSVLSKPSS